MVYFFTSDTHFGHTNILTYEKRPFKSVQEMDETIIKNWNNTVSSKDVVFFLGDFCIKGNSNRYKERLNGQIIFIKGNHDKKVIIQDLIIDYGGHFWHLAHKPEDCMGEFNLCGHVHSLWTFKKEKDKIWINVGMDVHNFKPIKINTILKILENGLQ